MSDFRTWSIDLGSWSGTRVRVHYFLMIFIALGLLDSSLRETPRFVPTLGWMALLVVALVLHELGHVAMAIRERADREDVLLWPLGNLVSPSRSRTEESPAVVAGGLAMSGGLAILTALFLALAGARMVFSPFGGPDDSGAPFVTATGTVARSLSPLWWAGWFGWLNWVIFLANLIPALPLDMGRILRATLFRPAFGPGRDAVIVFGAARTAAMFLAVAGVLCLFFSKIGGAGLSLIALALMIEIFVRLELRMMEDGRFYDEGSFGYDFSEGYTGLDAQAAKVRSAATEGTIKRWRRKRAEHRRRREQAEAAAESNRLDELLEKVHRVGKTGLTPEETRFLLRVSTKLRSRHKNHA